MNNDNCDMMLEELGILDCFVDAEERLEITSEHILKLKMRIDEEVTRNQIMLNCGVELLTLDEKLECGEISKKVYKKVKNGLIKKD